MNWRLQAVIAASVSLFGMHPAFPQLAPGGNCAKATTTVEINECTSRQARVADRQLNQVYQQLRPKISSKQRQRLTQAQLDWIKFRDRTCEYEAGEFEGGTAASFTYSSCLARVTTQRTADLQRYLEFSSL